MGSADVTPGSTVGTYTVQGILGATAWSETFVAADPGGKLVALRVVLDVDDDAWASIERERKLLATVPDHLVLPIVDAGVGSDPRVRFVATPLSDHPSLADLVEIYALSPAEAVALLKNVAIAVEAAHRAGLPHLALKPANVFVGPPPTYAAKLVDFGADALRRTKKERGALSWLAPEQIDASAAASAKADVFTLALLAFFSMTGKPYWSASAHDEAALLAEMRGPRRAPSARAKELGTTLPASVDAVLLRALGPASARFDSARAFAEALEATLAVVDPLPAASEEARSSERHMKAALKLDKFRMPTLENTAPSGIQPLGDGMPRLPPAPAPRAPPTPGPIVTPIEPVAMRPRRTIYIPNRVLAVLVVAVTTLTLGVTVAAVRKIRSTPLPVPSASVAASPHEPPGPPTAIVVPPPPPSVEDAESEAPSLSPDESELEIVCTPACERVFVDGKLSPEYPAPLRLPAGRHGIGVGKAGYGGQFRTVNLKGGERETVTFTLGTPTPKK